MKKRHKGSPRLPHNYKINLKSTTYNKSAYLQGRKNAIIPKQIKKSLGVRRAETSLLLLLENAVPTIKTGITR